MKQRVLDVMRGIAAQLKEEERAGVFSYVQQREIILRLFNDVSSYDISTIILRLTVIDSLYSTNAAYSYFSIEEMAKKIYSLGKDEAAAGLAEGSAGNLRACEEFPRV